MKKRLLVCLGVILLCSVFAACGNAGNSNASETEESIEETIEETYIEEAYEEENTDELEYYNNDEGWFKVYDPDGTFLGKYNIPEGYTVLESSYKYDYLLMDSEENRISVYYYAGDVTIGYVRDGIIPEDNDKATYTLFEVTNFEEYNVIRFDYAFIFNNTEFYNIIFLADEYKKDGQPDYVSFHFLPVDYDAWDDDDIAELIEEIFK